MLMRCALTRLNSGKQLALFIMSLYLKGSLIRTLLDPNASQSNKQVALKFIVHIIGDLHQPMHAGNGTDRGGGKHELIFFSQETNLHRVWDNGLIAKRGLSFTEWSNWLDKDISLQNIKSWQTNDPLVWIAEDVKIRDTIYPKQKEIGYNYLYYNLPIIKTRLKQAGIRLAYYLDQLFKGYQP